MGNLPDFERGQVVDARLTGVSVTKTTTLLGVSRATVAKVMSAYTNHERTSAKRNSGRKSKLAERDRRTLRSSVAKNHRTVADRYSFPNLSHLTP
jgi:transposase